MADPILDQLHAALDAKPANPAAMWHHVTGLLSARFVDDLPAWEQERAWILKALVRHIKLRPMPPDWVAHHASHAHLLPLVTSLTLIGTTRTSLDLVRALLAQDLSGLLALRIDAIPLARDGFETLCANPALASLHTLELHGTGLSDDLLPVLLAEGPLWTSLRSLTLQESRIKAAGAALIADCPRIARLTTLQLKGCPIGPKGREALGASPHLPDKLKSRARAVAPVRNEAAAEAPPSPRDTFGELRSWLQRADEQGWERVCDLFDQLHHSPDQARVTDELLPYAADTVARWPAALRLAPVAWIDAAMRGEQAPAALALASGLRLEGIHVTMERLRALLKGGQLGPLRALHVRGVTLSASALRALWPLCADLETLELRCKERGDALASALCDDAAPARLRDLSVRQNAAPATLARAIQRQAHLQRVRLSGELTNPLGGPAAWSALAEALADVPALELGYGALDPNLLAALQRPTTPTAHTSLLLAGAIPLHRIDTLAAYLRRCERLSSLSLELPGWADAPALASLLPADVAPNLTSLHVTISGSRDDDAAARWLDARPALTSLRLALSDSFGALYSSGQHSFMRSMLGAALARGESLETLAAHLLTGTAGDDALASAHLPKLQHLSLGQRVDSSALVRFLCGASLPALHTLALEDVSLRPEHVEALRQTPWWGQLRALSFRALDLVGEGAAPAQRLWESLPDGLTSLALNGLSGMAHPHRRLDGMLDRLPRGLRRLRLGAIPVDDATIRQLIAGLDQLDALEELDLLYCAELTEEHVIALMACPAIARLHRLRLHGVKLKFPGQQAIASSTHLHLEAKTHVIA